MIACTTQIRTQARTRVHMHASTHVYAQPSNIADEASSCVSGLCGNDANGKRKMENGDGNTESTTKLQRSYGI